jgi:adenylate kinase
MHYIVLGPQASGKGTQAQMLSQELGIIHISVGEKLREEVAAGTKLGHAIKEKLDRGELVDDDLVETMIRRLIQQTGKGFVLDGFPRTETQAKFLDNITTIEKVVVLKVKDKTAVERISGRRECPRGHDYHLLYNPPKKEGICDIEGLPLHKRSDDTTATIMKRLETFHKTTEPLIAHYKGKVIEVDGEKSIKDVHFDILKGLRKR